MASTATENAASEVVEANEGEGSSAAETGSEDGLKSKDAVQTSNKKQKTRSFVDAAWEKFHEDMVVDDSIQIFVPKKGPATITDSGHMILPWRVHMDDCSIADAGCLDNMSTMCAQVTELDLSHNKIASLEEVLKVIRCMPSLTFLNLSSNPMTSSSVVAAAAGAETNDVDAQNANTEIGSGATANLPPPGKNDDEYPATATHLSTSATGVSGSDSEADCSTLKDVKSQEVGASGFTTVRQLVMNDMSISWEGVRNLLILFPSLEELHLSLCNYSSIDLPETFTYPSLTHLYFNNNFITNCSQVNQLGQAFPSLRHLFLSDTEVSCLDDERMAELFPCLEMISLNKTKLSCYEEVDKLASLPCLVDVRLLGVPFLEAEEEKVRRHQLIARLPNIVRLNGSSVREGEREDAERAFIRLYMNSDDKPDRYYELQQKHGKLDPLAKVDLTPKMNYRVVVIYGDHREEIEVNANQTVRELKKSLQNIAGLPSNKFSVFYHCPQDNYGGIKLMYMDKKLYTMRINDGDEFIIQPIARF